MVTNFGGAITSAVAMLTVNVPPAIGVQPANRTVFAGADVVFTVNATGSPPLAYQWYFNGCPWPMAAKSAGQPARRCQ